MPKTLPTKGGVKSLTIEEEQAGQRIDNFLFTRLKGVPKSRIYRALRKGEIRVNKKRVKPDYRLNTADTIRLPPLTVAVSDKPSFMPYKLSELIENHIIYEDKGLIILNKPSGVPVHGGSGVSFGVIEVLRQSRPLQKSLELVHRLDRETSGCLLVAKKRSVLKELHQLLVGHKVVKIYLALVEGNCDFQEKVVDVPLKKYQLKSGERMVQAHHEGKHAETHFKTLFHYKNMTLLKVTPTTGRTHQIRVHAAYMGHPIIGDAKYGDDSQKTRHPELSNRLYLHAAEIGFDLVTGDKVSVCASLDDAWSVLMRKE